MTLPQTKDRTRWERRFAEILTGLVRVGGRPDLSAPDAWRQLRADWNASGFTGGPDVPVELDRVAISDSEAMRGLTDATDAWTDERRRDWLILARVEDERSLFPKEEWIRHDELERMAAVYDPAFRSAPVILPDGGSSHETGEYARHIPGRVQVLAFDGYHLWGLVVSRSGDLAFQVGYGAAQRSIRWWPKLRELPESPPYLRHVALLTGEQPGIPNLPSLEQHFFAESAGSDAAERIVSTQYRERTLPGGMMSTPTDPKGTSTGASPPTAAELCRSLVEDPALVATFAEALAPAVRACLEVGDGEDGDQKDDHSMRRDDTKASEVLELAKRTLQEVQDSRKELDAARKEHDEREQRRRDDRIAAEIDAGFRAGRMLPHDRDAYAAQAKGAEDVDALFSQWRSRPAILGSLAQRIEAHDDGTYTERHVPLAAMVPDGYGVAGSLDAARRLTELAPTKGGIN